MNPSLELTSSRRLAYFLMALLVVRAVIDADVVRRDYETAKLIQQTISGSLQPGGTTLDENTQQRIEQISRENAVAKSWYMLVVFPLPVLFLFFVFRARKNFEFLNVKNPEFSPTWAVSWFLIPFLNMIRPYAVMTEIWRASDPACLDELEWKRAPVSPLLLVWWLLFVFAFFGRPMIMVVLSKGSVEAVGGIMSASIWLQALAVPAAFLAIYVVREIEMRQSEKYRQLVMKGAFNSSIA